MREKVEIDFIFQFHGFTVCSTTVLVESNTRRSSSGWDYYCLQSLNLHTSNVPVTKKATFSIGFGSGDSSSPAVPPRTVLTTTEKTTKNKVRTKKRATRAIVVAFPSVVSKNQYIYWGPTSELPK